MTGSYLCECLCEALQQRIRMVMFFSGVCEKSTAKGLFYSGVCGKSAAKGLFYSGICGKSAAKGHVL
ncbi:hypothetical protein PVK06_047167 [Gossypium arboreum]|uniref:Uncharacterized protein n=1 Tax=Gossypium arboreum TaxID=29729 RepID=A0ABR0MCM5_GOSAR|nr:hypothetical protein PVK06_047167 [Gossypium arboreum]